MKITITLRGDKDVLKKLEKRQVNLKDFRTELDTIGKYLVNFHKIDVFETEGQIIGERWQNLKPSYEFKKRSEFPGRGILEATGVLRKSFVYSAQAKRMLFRNTQLTYGPTHQFGDSKRGIPKRMFFKITQQVQQKMVDILHSGLVKRLNQV